MKQLVELQSGIDKFADKKIGLVAISYDEVAVLAKFAEKQKITFPLLSDPGGKIIAAYGLTNKEAKGQEEGIPHPGTMILDKKGVIRAKLFYEGPYKRHTSDDVVKAADGIKE